MSDRLKRSLFFLTLALISVGAMAILYVSTPAGMGISGDSAMYVDAANNIVQGNGYARTSGGGEIKPLTHYPPLFSLSLAAGAAFIHYDPLRVARALIILLWGLGTALGGLLVWRMSRSRMAALVFAFLFAANGTLLFVYAVVMSEPLFFFFSFLAFLLLSLYFEKFPAPFGLRAGSWVWLAAAGAACGLAYLTRYSGLALLATFLVALFIVEKNGRSRFVAGLQFLGGALPFLLAWTLRNELEGLSVTNRELSFHPILASKIAFGFSQLWAWLVPGWFGKFTETWPVLSILKASRGVPQTPFLVVGALGLVLLVWCGVTAWRLWRLERVPAGQATFFSTTLYVFGYMAAILFSMSFFDASTPFQDRILAPVYISLLIVFVMTGLWLWRTGKWPLQALTVILALSVMAVSVGDNLRTVDRLQSDALGYASAHWRNSKTITAVEALPPGTILYSNSPTAIYILTDRSAYIMPTPVDPVDQQPRESFDDDLAQMRDDIKAGKAVLVVFDSGSNPAYYQMVTQGLPLYQKFGDGSIYGRP